MLRALAEGLWVIDHPVKIGPLQLGSRTTVLRLADGGLALVSPGKLSPGMREEILALGEVKALIAPNLFHHLYLGQATRAFPEAKVYAPPGLRQKLLAAGREQRVDEVLGDEPPALLQGAVQTHRVRGLPRLEEIALFHPHSKTLVLTDLCFNIRSSSSRISRAVWTLYGCYGRFGPTLAVRLLLRDKKAARASVDRILAWDFERVVVTHGEVLESDGKSALTRSFAWLRG